MAEEAWDRMVSGVTPLWHKDYIVASVRKRQPQRGCCNLKSQVSHFLQLSFKKFPDNPTNCGPSVQT